MVTPFVELGKTGDDPPKVKTSTAFAIVVDRQSYDKVRTAVEAYRDAIEKDGLATWILIDDWESPAEIRALLKELYEDRRMPLEGTVLSGIYRFQ